MFLLNPSDDLPRFWFTPVGGDCGELLVKFICDRLLFGVGFRSEGNWLIWGRIGAFAG